MSKLNKLSAFLAGILGLAAVEPAAPPVESGVSDDGKYVFAWIRQGAYTVRQRLPSHIRKLPEAEQSRLLDEALAKMKAKIARQRLTPIPEGANGEAVVELPTSTARDDARLAAAEEKRAKRAAKRRRA